MSVGCSSLRLLVPRESKCWGGRRGREKEEKRQVNGLKQSAGAWVVRVLRAFGYSRSPTPGLRRRGGRPAQYWEAVSECGGRCGNTEKRNAAIGEGHWKAGLLDAAWTPRRWRAGCHGNDGYPGGIQQVQYPYCYLDYILASFWQIDKCPLPIETRLSWNALCTIILRLSMLNLTKRARVPFLLGTFGAFCLIKALW